MADTEKSIHKALDASIQKALASSDIAERIRQLSAASEEARRHNLHSQLQQINKLIKLYRSVPSLSAYVGQEAIKGDLQKRIDMAKRQSRPLPHLLLCGPPEMGKITLAKAVAVEIGRNVMLVAASSIERYGDLGALVTNLEEGDLLLIEDVDQINELVLKALVEVLEDFQIEILIGKGSSTRMLRLDLKKFTVVGTTSRPSQVDKRLRRWMIAYNFSTYTADEIVQILQFIGERENLVIETDAAHALADHSGGSPGNARVMVKRVRDYLDPKAKTHVTLDLAQQALLSFGYLGKPSASIDLASKVQDMNALEFEEFVANLFREMGYAVETTAKSGDHGIDIFLRKDDQLIAVQCKRWDAPVGEPVIRDFLGSLTGAGANSGYVITSSTFTSSAYSFAQDKAIKLIDLDALMDLVTQHKAAVG